jgi:predicted transcriptional regulator
MITTRQIKAARSLLAWSQEDLASRSAVPYPTIARIEALDGRIRGRASTAAKIVTALESAGVIFIEENGEGPGVRLRKVK